MIFAVITILTLAYLLALALVVWQNFVTENGVEVLPSLAWAVLMVIPFAGQAHSFHEASLLPHSVGLFWFGFLLLAADLAAASVRNRQAIVFSDATWLRGAAIGLAGILVLWAVHVQFMPKIPLVEKYLHGVTDTGTLDLMREESSKLLHVPSWFIFACQVASQIIAPVLTVIFWRNKRYFASAFVISCALIYSRVTLAKGPIYVLMAILGLLLAKTLWLKAKKRFIAALLVGGSVVAAASAKVLLFDAASPVLYQEEDEAALQKLKAAEAVQGLSYTAADRYRLLVRQPVWIDASDWKRNITFFYYRIFLVPIEVAHRWYAYFPDVPGDFLGWYGLTPESRNAEDFRHPSNMVGLWAYKQRFPAQYGETVHAYAPIDADAYAHWGYPGLFFIGACMFWARLLMSWLRTNEPNGDLFYYATLFVLAVSLPVASIFAVMAAQGVLFCLIVLGILRLCCFIKSTKDGPFPSLEKEPA